MHEFMLVGNLGRDPEMRFTTSGQPCTNFSVADSRRYTNAAGELVEETLWVRVETYGRLAETCNQHLHKGRQVAIKGRIKPQRTWEKDGQTYKSDYEVVASEVQFLGPRGNGSGSSEAESAEVDEIPF
jgi:single-strand DNA-binding protein